MMTWSMTTTRTERQASPAFDPPSGCPLCPRLVGLRRKLRASKPDWHNAPVPTWVPRQGDLSVTLLIVGLAPGMNGANRTGLPFIGDQSGTALFASLIKNGLAHAGDAGESSDTTDHPRLINCAITNAVRCLPPQNRPNAAEINACRPFLEATIRRFPNLRAVLTLGRIAHQATVRALGGAIGEHRFGHGLVSRIGGLNIVASYHCSRYNMNTGRLTPAMLDAAIETARASAEGHPQKIGILA